MKWDDESVAIQAAMAEALAQPSSRASVSNKASDTELYDLESLMESQSGGSIDNELPDMGDLRADLAPIAWLTNPPASPPQDFVVSDNYRPATPIYSPTSHDYSPSQSPVHEISDSKEEYGYNPSHNSDGAIATRASDMFDLQNTDSDQEIDREAELISLVGEYINRGKLPREIHKVLLFPQPTNLHDLTWNEYPYEPCSNHCVMPSRTDKSFARFYLTHSLCLKHISSLSTMGPWLYLSNRISTKIEKIT